MTGFSTLYRKLERTLEAIEGSTDVARTLESLLEHILVTYREDLGFVAGRLYRLDGDRYVLERVVGEGAHPRDFALPVDYAPVVQVRSQGYVMMHPGEPGLRADLEASLGVDHFAAICFGPGKEFIIAFTLRPGAFDAEEVVYSLNAVRHVCDLKLRHRRMEKALHEAREIQESLINAAAPDLKGFDIAFRSRPAEEVGGDLCIFIPVNENILGFAVADVAGHGLTAALQARDVAIGLMMGISENLKMVATIEKLNKVIHETSMTSKFVTLFYGELETNGNLIYVNAGHMPATLLRTGTADPALLRKGGMVLGPSTDARYHRGFVELGSGDLLFLYSDGITDAEDGAGTSFGFDRLRRVITENRGLDATRLVARTFDEIDRFSAGQRQEDDQTLLVVRRV